MADRKRKTLIFPMLKTYPESSNLVYCEVEMVAPSDFAISFSR